MVTMAARISHGWLRSDEANSLASPKKLPVTDDGMPILASAALIDRHRVAQRRAGHQVEADGLGRELVLVADGQAAPSCRSILAMAVSGTCAPFVDGM